MRKFILYSFAILPFVSANAQSLKINVQKGQQYMVEESTRMTNSTNNNGEIFESLSESTNTFIYKITDFSKNEIEIRSECTRIVSHSKVMDMEVNYDSDKKENDYPTSKILSKRIGKQKKLVLDLNGKIIKEDKPEKDEDSKIDMSWLSTGWATPLFIPELIGKNIKAGDSIPVAISYFKEKPSTSFSFSKESIALADTGTFTITSIRDGIAIISYTGIETITMAMKIGDKPINNISNLTVRMDLSIDVNTGVVISSTRTEVSIMKEGGTDIISMDMKSTSTTKITLLE